MKSYKNLIFKYMFSTSSILVLAAASVCSLILWMGFRQYLYNEQESRIQLLVQEASDRYDENERQWDTEGIVQLGRFMLEDGCILRLYDVYGNLIWDAAEEWPQLTAQAVEVARQTPVWKYLGLSKGFQERGFILEKEGAEIGSLHMSGVYPISLTVPALRFLHILALTTGIISLLTVVVVMLHAQYITHYIARPAVQVLEATRRVAAGDYSTRIHYKSSTRELALLIDSINAMVESLDKMEKTRKQLTGDVAHELRTPLSILSTHLEAMEDGVWEVTPALLNSCNDEVLRIARLVGDMERLSRLEQATEHLQPQWISLQDVFDQVWGFLKKEGEKRKIHIEVTGEGSTVYGDRDKLYQVFYNLLSNSIKYTSPGGRIGICFFEEGNSAGFQIEDNGIGISPEDLPYIFERFFRADKSRNRSTGGSGIGLTIVKTIVHAHGGEVYAESKEGEGSRFVVKLPKEWEKGENQ